MVDGTQSDCVHGPTVELTTLSAASVAAPSCKAPRVFHLKCSRYKSRTNHPVPARNAFAREAGTRIWHRWLRCLQFQRMSIASVALQVCGTCGELALVAGASRRRIRLLVCYSVSRICFSFGGIATSLQRCIHPRINCADSDRSALPVSNAPDTARDIRKLSSQPFVRCSPCSRLLRRGVLHRRTSQHAIALAATTSCRSRLSLSALDSHAASWSHRPRNAHDIPSAVYDRSGPVCGHPLSRANPPSCSCSFNRGRPHLGFCVLRRRSVSDHCSMMLDAVCLSEEELSVLFGPASHGASQSMLRSGKKPSRVSTAPGKRTQQRKKKTNSHATHAVEPARCGYRTGKCQNLQAVKRNGKLHKLCEFHRERANLNQKKLDRKKRMQRPKRSTPSTAESVTSEDDAQVLRADRSPRNVEASVSSDVFVKAEQELAMEELFLPTSLDEAPLVLGCEELAIFCSLMTVDATYRSVDPPSVHTPSCHYYTSIV